MENLLVFKLRSIAYSGDNIGNDLIFQFTIGDKTEILEPKLSYNGSVYFNRVLSAKNFSETIDNAISLTIEITEKDPKFDDTDSSSIIFTIDPEDFTQQFTFFSTNVIGDSRGDKNRIAQFDFVFSAKISDTIEDSPDDLDLPISPPYDFEEAIILPEDFDSDLSELTVEETAIFNFPDEYLITNTGDILYNDINGSGEYFFTSVGRTQVGGNCGYTAFFGVEFTKAVNKKKKARFSSLQPEFGITSNNSFTVQIAIAKVFPFPGKLVIKVTRNGPGTNKSTEVEISAMDEKKLKEETSKRGSGILIAAPPNMNGTNNKSILETLIATVTWIPDNGLKKCKTTKEELNIRWQFVPKKSRADYFPPNGQRKGKSKSVVTPGETPVIVALPDKRVIVGVPVQAFFTVKEATQCCKDKTDHSVIHFVRHVYRLNGFPALSDKWSLDILQTEIDKTKAKPPKKYDPRYTHNPCNTNPKVDPIVYPGPNPVGKISVVLKDRPALPLEVYKRFRSIGGKFTWQYISFLVCTLKDCGSKEYIEKGKVEQVITYNINLDFPAPVLGIVAQPKVTLTNFSVSNYKKCKPLKELITAFDKGSPKQRGKTQTTGDPGKLIDGYNKPRDHKIALPRRR